MRPQLLDPRPYFAGLLDPRRETRNKLHKLHKLHDFLMIVLCAVLSGVEDRVGMADLAEEREDWLRRFLEPPNGISPHDILSDVLGRIDPAAFRTAFAAWATAALPPLADEQVCVDGKAVRGSRDGAKPAAHLVSAFAGRVRWVLVQQAVAEKSRSSPPASSGSKPAPTAATSCARWRNEAGLRPRRDSTGASKIDSTGSWACNSEKMPAGPARTARRKIRP